MSVIPDSSHRFSQPRIAVIGAGVVGLSCAIECARRGAVVRVYESGEAAGAGASSCAAGMLGLAYEAPEYASPALANLARRSMQLWPDFAQSLHVMTGGGCNFRADGTIACALSAEDETHLNAIEAACDALNLPCADVAQPVSALEPALTGDVVRAVRLKTDMQVDARLLVARLAVALEALDGRCVTHASVDQITVRNTRFATPDGEIWDQVLLATGASGAVQFVDADGGAYAGLVPAMEKVKGQILALEPMVGAPRHVVRSGALYVVPKHDATLIGGVSQTGAADLAVERDVLDNLRQRATRLLPGLAMAREMGAWAGFRPRTADGVPVMGQTRLPGVFIAGGHFRNGVMLAPATGEWMAQLMLDGREPQGMREFSPMRFDSRVEPSHSL